MLKYPTVVFCDRHSINLNITQLEPNTTEDVSGFVVLNSASLPVLHTDSLNILLGFTMMIIPILRIDSDISDRMDFDSLRSHDFNY